MACSLLLVLFSFEIALRIQAPSGSKTSFDREALPPPIPEGPVALGHLIKPASNPDLVYDLRPDLDVEFIGKRVRTNHEGFRQSPPLYPADLGEGSLLVGVGDSTAFGWGVADDETYLSLVTTGLRHQYPKQEWRSLNIAVPGYNTVMEVAALRDKVLPCYRPRLVLLDFVANDLDLPNFLLRPQRFSNSRRLLLWDSLLRRLRPEQGDLETKWPVVEAQPGLVHAPLGRHNPKSFESDLERIPAELHRLVGWESWDAAMVELATMAREQDFRVVMVSLEPGRSTTKVAALARGRELGFPTIDVGQNIGHYLRRKGLASSGYPHSPLALGPIDTHPSAAGHALAAQSILRNLEKLFHRFGEIGEDSSRRDRRASTRP